MSLLIARKSVTERRYSELYKDLSSGRCDQSVILTALNKNGLKNVIVIVTGLGKSNSYSLTYPCR